MACNGAKKNTAGVWKVKYREPFKNGAQYFDEQPDCGGNRHYDYISVEEHDAAEKSLAEKEHWGELTTNEIFVLRFMARQHRLEQDVVDHRDRLALLRCLFSHCANRDEWMEKARALEKGES